jgi:hypothetical protein
MKKMQYRQATQPNQSMPEKINRHEKEIATGVTPITLVNPKSLHPLGPTPSVDASLRLMDESCIKLGK